MGVVVFGTGSEPEIDAVDISLSPVSEAVVIPTHTVVNISHTQFTQTRLHTLTRMHYYLLFITDIILFYRNSKSKV